MAWKRRRTRRAGRHGGKKDGLERGGKKGGLERGGRRVTEGRKREQRRECRRINVSAQGRRRVWGGILLC